MDFTSEDFRSKEPMIREWILTHPNEPATEMIRTLLDEIEHVKRKAPQMKFYTFSQNNSGGRFDFFPSKGISLNVIIEASSADDANDRAERAGLYFDGCEAGQDCECCGDRWSRAWMNDGKDSPMVYGDKVVESSGDIADAYIHYSDGRIVQATHRKRMKSFESAFSKSSASEDIS